MSNIPVQSPTITTPTALVPIGKPIFSARRLSTSDFNAIDSDPLSERRKRLHTMSQFRSKTLDLAGFINARVIRDHTKRKVFEKHEPERYVFLAYHTYMYL